MSEVTIIHGVNHVWVRAKVTSQSSWQDAFRNNVRDHFVDDYETWTNNKVLWYVWCVSDGEGKCQWTAWWTGGRTWRVEAKARFVSRQIALLHDMPWSITGSCVHAMRACLWRRVHASPPDHLSQSSPALPYLPRISSSISACGEHERCYKLSGNIDDLEDDDASMLAKLTSRNWFWICVCLKNLRCDHVCCHTTRITRWHHTFTYFHKELSLVLKCRHFL